MNTTQEKREYQPKTGEKCSCRPGVQRDNCPNCEGTGWVINFRLIRERSATGRVISSAVMTDDEQDKLDAILGQKLADALHLKRDATHRDRWATTWGSKTSLGLWRTVKRMIGNPEEL